MTVPAWIMYTLELVSNFPGRAVMRQDPERLRRIVMSSALRERDEAIRRPGRVTKQREGAVKSDRNMFSSDLVTGFISIKCTRVVSEQRFWFFLPSPVRRRDLQPRCLRK